MPKIVLHRNNTMVTGGKHYAKGVAVDVSPEIAAKLIGTGRFVDEETYLQMLTKDKSPEQLAEKNPPKLVLDPATGNIIKKTVPAKAAPKKGKEVEVQDEITIPNIIL